jgi:hypothetical protein
VINGNLTLGWCWPSVHPSGIEQPVEQVMNFILQWQGREHQPRRMTRSTRNPTRRKESRTVGDIYPRALPIRSNPVLQIRRCRRIMCWRLPPRNTAGQGDAIVCHRQREDLHWWNSSGL